MSKVFGVIGIASFALVGLSACNHSQGDSNQPVSAAPKVLAKVNTSSPVAKSLGLRRLKPASRFNEYQIGEKYADAQQALNQGDVETAYNTFAERDRSLDGPRERRFDDVLDVAFQQWSKTSPAADYAERLVTNFIPAAEKLQTSEPGTDEEYTKRLNAIDALAQNLQDGADLPLNTKQKAVRARFMAILSGKQRLVFPVLRKHYKTVFGPNLFRANVDLAITGPQSTVARLTSGMFSINSNIADAEDTMSGALRRLRFKKMQFRWSRYFEDGYHYDLKSPDDGVIVIWEAGTAAFRQIKK